MKSNINTAIQVAADLLIKIRGNCTTLEVKKYLRASNYNVTQQEVSDEMAQMHELDYTDNGVFRTYVFKPEVVAEVKKDKKKFKSASKSKMVSMMKSSGGRFITVTFEKKDNTLRTMNCRVNNADFMNAQGYINVSENRGSKGTRYRQVNPRTIQELKINGKHYTRK
jgi:hypothetical protein